MKHIEIYTDGACSGNPGPGGWGAILRFRTGEKVYEKEISGGEAGTTNNRMELTGLLEALRQLKEPCDIDLDLASKVDYYKRQIVESGALERDRQRWTGYSMYGYANPEEEAEYIKSWYIARLKYLETIFNNF